MYIPTSTTLGALALLYGVAAHSLFNRREMILLGDRDIRNLSTIVSTSMRSSSATLSLCTTTVTSIVGQRSVPNIGSCSYTATIIFTPPVASTYTKQDATSSTVFTSSTSAITSILSSSAFLSTLTSRSPETPTSPQPGSTQISFSSTILPENTEAQTNRLLPTSTTPTVSSPWNSVSEVPSAETFPLESTTPPLSSLLSSSTQGVISPGSVVAQSNPTSIMSSPAPSSPPLGIIIAGMGGFTSTTSTTSTTLTTAEIAITQSPAIISTTINSPIITQSEATPSVLASSIIIVESIRPVPTPLFSSTQTTIAAVGSIFTVGSEALKTSATQVNIQSSSKLPVQASPSSGVVVVISEFTISTDAITLPSMTTIASAVSDVSPGLGPSSTMESQSSDQPASVKSQAPHPPTTSQVITATTQEVGTLPDITTSVVPGSLASAGNPASTSATTRYDDPPPPPPRSTSSEVQYSTPPATTQDQTNGPVSISGSYPTTKSSPSVSVPITVIAETQTQLILTSVIPTSELAQSVPASTETCPTTQTTQTVSVPTSSMDIYAITQTSQSALISTNSASNQGLSSVIVSSDSTKTYVTTQSSATPLLASPAFTKTYPTVQSVTTQLYPSSTSSASSVSFEGGTPGTPLTQPAPGSTVTASSSFIPAPILVGVLTVFQNSASNFIIGSQTVKPGSAATVSGQVISVNSGGAIIMNPAPTSTPTSNAHSETLGIVVGSSSITANSASNLMAGSQISVPGNPSSTTVGYELTSATSLATTSVFNTNPIVVFGGSTFTENSASAFVIGSQTLFPSSAITISGQAISLSPTGNAVIINAAPQVSPSPTTMVTSAAEITSVVIAGNTLTKGGKVTVGGDILSLAPSGTGIVVIGTVTVGADQSLATAAKKKGAASNLCVSAWFLGLQLLVFTAWWF